MDHTRESWVRAQKKALLLSPSGTLCINRYRTETAAASRADDINNDKDLDWPSSDFRATYDYREESEDQAFEVVILLRSEADRNRLINSLAEQDEDSEDPETAKNRRLVSKEELRLVLGGDGVASRAVNCLSRELGLHSLSELVDLYRKLGHLPFLWKVSSLRNMGDVSVQRILGVVAQ